MHHIFATVLLSNTLIDFSTPGLGNVEKPELRQGQTLRALQVTCTFLYARTTDTQRGIVFTAQPKSNPSPKFLDLAEAYFVCHIGPIFQISLIYAFIGCP